MNRYQSRRFCTQTRFSQADGTKSGRFGLCHLFRTEITFWPNQYQRVLPGFQPDSKLKMLLQRLGMSEERCQILMGPKDFEINELQKEIVADNVCKSFSEALKKIRRLEELSQSADDSVLQQFLLRVSALAGYEEDGQRFAYDFSTQRQMLIKALELTCPGITMDTIGNFLLGEDEAKIIIKQNAGKSGIIYCLSRKKVEELSELLNVNGIKSLPYHAGLDAATRAANQDKFLMEEIDVIVATIAFGMGIDKPDVRFVIHYNFPKSLEGYYQETGRAGRDGGEGQCIAFYSYKDIQKLEKFMQSKPLAEQEIGRQLLNDTVAYAESNTCRRKSLLNYFGETYQKENCGNCDNCLHPKAQFEGKEFMCMVIELITSMKENFKAEHLANILGGVSNSIIKSYNHHKLELFGIIPNKGADFWLAIIRQGLILQLLYKEVEKYGLITVTPKGLEFYKKPWSIMLTEDRKFDDSDDDDETQTAGNQKHHSGAGDEALLSMLKDVRQSLSKRLNIPPFVIFQDPSLEDMSIMYPTTIEELKACQGVGEGKAKKFGNEFIRLIAKYVEENDIIRPTDFLVKTVPVKSSNKISIIKSVDRRTPLDEIADSLNIDMEQLYNEIESIVNSGTKINIDYYIRQVVDDDKVGDIYEYFKEEAVSDSVNEALKALGPDYTEEEVRLIRIKFLSEVGN